NRTLITESHSSIYDDGQSQSQERRAPTTPTVSSSNEPGETTKICLPKEKKTALPKDEKARKILTPKKIATEKKTITSTTMNVKNDDKLYEIEKGRVVKEVLGASRTNDNGLFYAVRYVPDTSLPSTNDDRECIPSTIAHKYCPDKLINWFQRKIRWQPNTKMTESISIRRVAVHDPTEIPLSYGTTPGGSIFSTTPGGTRIYYDRQFLLSRRDSPLTRSPPVNLPYIPEVTLIPDPTGSGTLQNGTIGINKKAASPLATSPLSRNNKNNSSVSDNTNVNTAQQQQQQKETKETTGSKPKKANDLNRIESYITRTKWKKRLCKCSIVLLIILIAYNLISNDFIYNVYFGFLFICRHALIKIEPFYDWSQIYYSPCFISNPFFNNTLTDTECNLYLQHPILSKLDLCSFDANVNYKHQRGAVDKLMKEILQHQRHSFIAHWSNCEKEAIKIIRSYYSKPYFLPPSMALTQIGSWFFVSQHYEKKTLNKIPMDFAWIWLAQIQGSSKILLRARDPCSKLCQSLPVLLNHGDLIMYSHLYDAYYTPIGDENILLAQGVE
ncbi:unnamed protein product, partial [Didymodactylos carnosus]